MLQWNTARTFESLVGQLLEKLRAEHPDTVTVCHHPTIRLHNDQVVIPDFELTYRLPFQTDHRLIECQDRGRSSQDILHKIRSVRALGSRNRFIFLYRSRQSVSDELQKCLDADGTVHYDIYEFAVVLEALGDSLAELNSKANSGPLTKGRYLNTVRSWEKNDEARMASESYLKEMQMNRKWHKDEGLLGGG